jgi:mycothiol synthase
MSLRMRPYQSEDDYWRARAFLREVFQRNAGCALSWDVCRFDYWRWHAMENCEQKDYREYLFLWEDAQGRIAALLTPEGLGEAFLHVHPDAGSPALEEEMIALAEERLQADGAPGTRTFTVWAHAGDPARQALLRARGYQRGDWPEHQRRRWLEQPLPEGTPGDRPLPQGFQVRALGERDELPARSWLSWKAFHPDEPDEKYQGWEWYLNLQRAPLYRRDLDLVVTAEDGTLAAFCTVWFDDASRAGIFEPVGVHPDFQRRGLGAAVMAEGARRLRRLGALAGYVSSYSEAAGGLYAALGFAEYALNERWQKTV